jgi:hypothetical protein
MQWCEGGVLLLLLLLLLCRRPCTRLACWRTAWPVSRHRQEQQVCVYVCYVCSCAVIGCRAPETSAKAAPSDVPALCTSCI